jgi:large subunit ribosomal protein L28
MARCEICLKSGQSGNNVSHSKRRTRHRWHANVHKSTIYVDGAPQRIKICTRCLRTRYKVTAKA